MTVRKGREVVLKVGGTPTTMTTEATTEVSGTVFQITDATKRVIDPDTAVAVEAGGAPVASTAYSVDYTTGTITFSSPPTPPVTVTGKYLPLLAVSYARALSCVRPQAQFAETTLFGDAAPRRFEIAKRCELVIDHLHGTGEVLDADLAIDTLLAAGTPFFVQADLGGEVVRGWFLGDQERSGGVDDVQTEKLTLKGQVRTCAGRPGTDQALFSISSS